MDSWKAINPLFYIKSESPKVCLQKITQKLKITCCLLVKEKRFKFGNQHILKNLGQMLEKNQILTEQVLNGKNNLITKRGKYDNKL